MTIALRLGTTNIDEYFTVKPFGGEIFFSESVSIKKFNGG